MPQLCDIAGQCAAAVHALHLAAVIEDVMASILDRVSSPCGNQALDTLDHPASPSAPWQCAGAQGWCAGAPVSHPCLQFGQAWPSCILPYTRHVLPRAMLSSTFSLRLTWELNQTVDDFSLIESRARIPVVRGGGWGGG